MEAMLRKDEGFVESESFVRRIQHPCYTRAKDVVVSLEAFGGDVRITRET